VGKVQGQTVYIDYKLDERHTLSVSSITRDGKELVHDEILLYLYDWSSKRRLDLKIYEWEKQTAKKPSQMSAAASFQQRNVNEKTYPPIGQSLAEPDVPTGLLERKGDRLSLHRQRIWRWPDLPRISKNKGPLLWANGLSIMTHHARATWASRFVCCTYGSRRIWNERSSYGAGRRFTTSTWMGNW